MLSPRSIAVQGFGNSTRLIAVQGLFAVSAEPVYGGGYWNLPAPMNLQDAQRARLLSEDELFLLMGAFVAAAGILN